MDKIYFDNGLRRQCLNVQPLSMEQFDRSVESFQKLLSTGELCNVKRIIATGCGDSYLAAAEAKEAFARYLPDVEYEAPTAMEAGRYLELAEKEPETVVVGISVSGGTARVTEVLERGKKHGCITVALTDVPGSQVANAANLLYHTNTPEGDNISGLRTYYVSMISLYVMAAALAEVRTGGKFLEELREQVSLYCEAFFAEYYPPWEPPVSRFRATRKWYFPPSEPPQHIVAAHIFDFTINLLIVILGELLMQYHQIIYREVFLCLRRQKSEVFWNFWEKI